MAKEEALYNVVVRAPEEYTVLKYDGKTLDDVGYYIVNRGSGRFGCNCLQGKWGKPTCRHREMLLIFEEANAVGSSRLYNYDKKRWSDKVLPTWETSEGNYLD